MATNQSLGQASEVATSWTLSTAVEKMTEAPEVIMLKIGEYETSIHKSLLIHFSEYYRLTLCGPFLEATTQQVDPIDDLFDKTTLQTFIGWIYTGETNFDATDVLHITSAVELYIFADRYAIPALRQILLQWLNDSHDPTSTSYQDVPLPPQAAVVLAFDNLPEKDDLCIALAHIYARAWVPAKEVALIGYPAAFGHLVVPLTAKLRTEFWRSRLDPDEDDFMFA
ncbi:hypothetical protein KVT40_006967 [Elsinoe batatas]|uniref:BTB domain-containing protein n=1 Tax=Elsinoe batatas TaxID=2601811 RepID=A0A8K0PD28_9PEZI|nr:hypothetical protein KVT40_006967 [Elsinoe batatas]